QGVLRVDARGRFVGAARHAVRAREQDEPMDRLRRPAALNEAGREKIEQLRMRRAVPHGAEVVDGPHDAAAEIALPDAIDHDAREQRSGGAREALRQLEPAAAAAYGRLIGAAEDLQKSPRNAVAERLVVAAYVHANVVRLVVAADHREGGFRDLVL